MPLLQLHLLFILIYGAPFLPVCKCLCLDPICTPCSVAGQLQYYDPRDDEDVDVMAMSGPPVDPEAWVEEAPHLVPLLADWDPFDPTGEEEEEEEEEEEGDVETEEGGEEEEDGSFGGLVGTIGSSSGEGEEEEGELEVVEGEVIGPEKWAELRQQQQQQQQQQSEGERLGGE